MVYTNQVRYTWWSAMLGSLICLKVRCAWWLVSPLRRSITYNAYPQPIHCIWATDYMSVPAMT
jgi:hypothetical protein